MASKDQEPQKTVLGKDKPDDVEDTATPQNDSQQREVLTNFFQSLLSSPSHVTDCVQDEIAIHHDTLCEMPEQVEFSTTLPKCDSGKPDVRIGGVKMQTSVHSAVKTQK